MMMLDSNIVQVLFADLQPQIVARSKTNRPDALARSAAALAQVARLLRLPIHLSAAIAGCSAYKPHRALGCRHRSARPASGLGPCERPTFVLATL
jgi:hypothetical protein